MTKEQEKRVVAIFDAAFGNRYKVVNPIAYSMMKAAMLKFFASPSPAGVPQPEINGVANDIYPVPGNANAYSYSNGAVVKKEREAFVKGFEYASRQLSQQPSPAGVPPNWKERIESMTDLKGMNRDELRGFEWAVNLMESLLQQPSPAGVGEDEMDELVEKRLTGMMRENPAKLMPYFVCIAGKECVAANAETLTVSCEADIEDSRYQITNQTTVKKVGPAIGKLQSQPSQPLPTTFLPEPFNKYVNDVHCYNEQTAVQEFAAALKDNRDFRFALSKMIVEHNLRAQPREQPTEGEWREKSMDDAPIHYNHDEAPAWANGYNSCLENVVAPLQAELTRLREQGKES